MLLVLNFIMLAIAIAIPIAIGLAITLGVDAGQWLWLVFRCQVIRIFLLIGKLAPASAGAFLLAPVAGSGIASILWVSAMGFPRALSDGRKKPTPERLLPSAPCERGLGSFLYCAPSSRSLRLAAKLRSSTELSAGRC